MVLCCVIAISSRSSLFAGNSGDLRLVRCYLELALPRANFDFLMSEVNQVISENMRSVFARS